MREVGEASVLSSVWAMASKGDPLVVSLLPRHGGQALRGHQEVTKGTPASDCQLSRRNQGEDPRTSTHTQG